MSTKEWVVQRDTSGWNIQAWVSFAVVQSILGNRKTQKDSTGWVFQTVWMWNDAKSLPELLSVGKSKPYSATAGTLTQTTQAVSAANLPDLLTRQVRANIWL